MELMKKSLKSILKKSRIDFYKFRPYLGPKFHVLVESTSVFDPNKMTKFTIICKIINTYLNNLGTLITQFHNDKSTSVKILEIFGPLSPKIMLS